MPINYKDYPANWHTEIRPRILKRANWKCEKCGVSNHVHGYREKNGNFVECDQYELLWAKQAGKKIIRIVLTIAHLNHNVNDNRDENLRAWCQYHHNRHDAEYRKLNRMSKKGTISDSALSLAIRFEREGKASKIMELRENWVREKEQLVQSTKSVILTNSQTKTIIKMFKALSKFNTKITILSILALSAIDRNK